MGTQPQQGNYWKAITTWDDDHDGDDDNDI